MKPMHAGGPAGAQHIGVVDAVAASQRGGDQRHYLVSGVGPARRAAEVEVLPEELGQAKAQGEGGGKEQAGIGLPGGGHQRRCGSGRDC